jgi:hypothetical protein
MIVRGGVTKDGMAISSWTFKVQMAIAETMMIVLGRVNARMLCYKAL